ncbi:Hypothetical protein NTJ_12582 [Nesidiocoris tenuis]|uniref:Uncharacterized protein n=1 Tax=Nesidiocoris tenuis TaxID=355587 RepID=A0ABN7B982_9HEMI|nr:Hypothetical protein NTJ_12582 [Nesidiocoris tenuis]
MIRVAGHTLSRAAPAGTHVVDATGFCHRETPHEDEKEELYPPTGEPVPYPFIFHQTHLGHSHFVAIDPFVEAPPISLQRFPVLVFSKVNALPRLLRLSQVRIKRKGTRLTWNGNPR